MPNIPTFEAGIEGLHPSDRGSTAMREAAVVQVRTANVAADATRRAGQTIGSGLQSLGSALGGIEEKAQAHTDAMAEIDFQNGLTASEIGAFGAIGTASTPTDKNNQPITDHVGRGGETSLSPDDNVPSPGQYAQVASNVTQRHTGILGGLLDSLPGFGVSQKAQDRMTAQAAASQRRLAVHAAARDAELQVTHAVHSIEQQVNQSIAAVGRGDVPLSDGLAQLNETFDSASRLGTGVAGGKLNKHVEEMRTVGRYNMIKESMEADVNKGQFASAMQKLDDKKYDAELGGKREELRTHLNSLNNQFAANENRKQAQQDRQDAINRDTLTDNVIRNLQKPLAEQDPNLSYDRLAKDSLFKGNPKDLEAAQKSVQLSIDRSIDPYKSNQLTEQAVHDVTMGKISTREEGEAFYNEHRHEMTWQDRGRLQTEIQQATANPGANNAIKDWLKRGGEGNIDTAFAKGTGTLPEGRSQLGQQRIAEWEAELKRRMQGGEKVNDLLNPQKAGSMTAPDTLANYRTTMQQEQKFKTEQSAADEVANRARANLPPGQAPTIKPPAAAPTTPAPTPGGQDALGRTGGQGARIEVPATMSLLTPEGRAAGVTQMLKQYQPGTKVVVAGKEYTIPPAGTTFQVDGKTYTVPGATPTAVNPSAAKQMNYAPPSGGVENTPAQQAITRATASAPQAAIPQDVHAQYARATIQVESGGKTGQRTGSYEGLGQFSKAEQRRLGITDPDNRGQVNRALAKEAETFRPALTKALGHEPDPADYYLAHQQGLGGAVAHLTHPDQPAWLSMAQTGEGRQKGAAWAQRAIWGNMSKAMKAEFPGGVKTVTSQDFVDMWRMRFDRAIRQTAPKQIMTAGEPTNI